MSSGARIIFKSSFLNPSKNSSGGSGTYAEYIGTREGAVRISESTKGLPVTDSQKEFINEILRKYPNEKESLAYHEFERMQTIGNASLFITDSVDKHGSELKSLDGYAEYMATRPGVVKIHDTGLFSDGNEEVKLEDVKEELSNYKGNVYLPIISLRPEDSIGLGYDNPDAWHELVERHRDDFAKEYHIKPENLKWIGAFHHATNDDGVIHNHIHMMVWSKNPNEGWQTKDTGVNLKRELANDIFQNERLDVLQTSSKTRDQIKEEAIDNVIAFSEKIKINGLGENTEQLNLINKEMIALSKKLKDYKGRKYYGYMKPEVKQMIDNIMDDLFEQNPDLKEMYSQWYDAKDAQVQIYKMGRYEYIPPSQNSELKKIKTEIINEAIKIGKAEDIESYETLMDDLNKVKENKVSSPTKNKYEYGKLDDENSFNVLLNKMKSLEDDYGVFWRTLSRKKEDLSFDGQNREFDKIRYQIIKDAIRNNFVRNLSEYNSLIDKLDSLDNDDKDYISELAREDEQQFDSSKKYMEESLSKYKGDYIICSYEEAGGCNILKVALTRKELLRAIKDKAEKYSAPANIRKGKEVSNLLNNVTKEIRVELKDNELSKDEKEKRKKQKALSKKQIQLARDYKLCAKPSVQKNYIPQRVAQSSASLLTNAILGMAASVGGHGHARKQKGLAVEFDEEEYFKKIALGMRM